MRALLNGTLLLLTVIAAAPKPISVGALDFNLVNVEAKEGAFYSEHFSTALERAGISVLTGREIAAVLGMERQKQLLGCGENSTSCMAELADALGTDGLLVADFAKLGAGYHLNARVLRSGNAELLASVSVPIDGQVDILPSLEKAAGQIAAELNAELRPQTAPPPVTLRSRAWIPAAVGGAALAFGGVSLMVAQSRHQDLTRFDGTTLDPAQAREVADSGKQFQTLGIVGAGVGLAGLLTAGAFYALGGPSTPVGASISASPSSASLTFGGSF